MLIQRMVRRRLSFEFSDVRNDTPNAIGCTSMIGNRKNGFRCREVASMFPPTSSLIYLPYLYVYIHTRRESNWCISVVSQGFAWARLPTQTYTHVHTQCADRNQLFGDTTTVYIRIYTCIHTYVHVCTYKCICIYMFTYTYICICMYIYMYKCIHEICAHAQNEHTNIHVFIYLDQMYLRHIHTDASNQ